MDKFSEVEIKLDATGLDPKKFMEFVINCDERIDRIKIISGWDTYYKSGEDIVRHRCDGDDKDSVLTVKKRKNNGSIIDRFEVDMPIKAGTPPEMVTAFLEMSGFKSEFTINKKYHFFNVSGKDYEACVAMYDVWKAGDYKKKYRFLEVEIERESKCSSTTAKRYLDEWLERINKSLLPDAKPLNSSLYELFTTKENK